MDYLGKIRRLLKEVVALWSMTDFSTWVRNLGVLVIGLPLIIKDGNLQRARLRMFGRKYKFYLSGKEIILDGKYFGRGTELYIRNVYLSLPEFKLSPEMTVFDLGANMGIFTVLAALSSKKVVAVEAIKQFHKDIKKNLDDNNCRGRVLLVWGMVGAGTGMLANEKVRKKWLGENPPPVYSISELMKKTGTAKIDFMKIDIEGSEFDLFKKKEKWFSKVHYIAMEVHNPFFSDGIKVPGGDIQMIVDNLKGTDFDVKLVDLDGRIVNEIKDDAGYLFAKNLNFRDNKSK